MPDNEMLGNPNDGLGYVGFGYTGLGICNSCCNPDHLFVASVLSDSDYCLLCHTRRLDGYAFLVQFPDKVQFPVLDDEVESCEICERPILSDSINWKGHESGAWLNDGTKVKAHVTCTRKVCDVCPTAYAVTHNRDWLRERNSAYKIGNARFTSTLLIEGQQHCDNCKEEFWLNNDADDYFDCDYCESLTHNDNSGWWNGTRYCQNCIDNNVYDCRECGVTRWDGDDHYCEDDDDEDESLIHSYSYRPSPFFFGEGKYHFGFELEVEARGNGRYDGAQIAQTTLGGHAYLKEDGSLSDGFEIVSHPHTLEKYHQEFNWDVLTKLQSQGYRSWNTRTCGLHVHVSRTAFGDINTPWHYSLSSGVKSQIILKRQAHELRFMKLIYDNQRQVERIAGRSNNNYATFQDKGNLVRKVKEGYQGNGRYSAINTDNDDTIEVRVFKGSLRKERVLSAIEFVHASIEYTRNIKVTNKNHALSWLKFTGYVAANAELYPNLVTIMSESFAGDDNPNESDN